MKKTLQIFMMTLLAATLLNAAPARGGLHTYTQADGSSFQATLKGDAAFHWMQSNGEVIMYNPQDKNYYNAELTSDGKFVIGKQKAGTRVRKSAGLHTNANTGSQTLDNKKRAALQRLQRAAKQGSHPR